MADSPASKTPSVGPTAVRVGRWMRRHKITTGLGAVLLIGALGNAGAGHPATDEATIKTASARSTGRPTPPPELTAAAVVPVPASRTQALLAARKAATPTPAPSNGIAAAGVLAGFAGPNSRLTPGSVMAASTKARVCTSGYSASVRNVTVATRRQVFAAYGIGYPPPTGAYELDHLIPLELGGDNKPTNLWPEAYHTRAGSAGVKDHLENHLHALVCSGQVNLAAAQQAIAGNWWAAAARYNPMPVRATTRTVASTPSPRHTSTPVVTSPGSGATALCRDGTYSFAAHHRGACSHHGGVATFYR